MKHLMEKLWKYIENKAWKAETKYLIILLIPSMLAALVGGIVWSILQNWFLSSWDFLVCFATCPAMLTWLLTYFYCCKHEF